MKPYTYTTIGRLLYPKYQPGDIIIRKDGAKGLVLSEEEHSIYDMEQGRIKIRYKVFNLETGKIKIWLN